LRKLIDDAIDYSTEKENNLLKIYQVHRWGDQWEECQQKKGRTLDSVVLDSNVAETVINDIKRFMDSGDWYASKGVPYRRGYLLYGPPGTGKTSFT
jgi:chaperone BCS1